MRKLTMEERVRNAASSQEVEFVKAEHQYLHARADGPNEFGRFWVKSENAAWGHMFGVMVGFEQIWFNNCGWYDMKAFSNWLGMFQDYPEVCGKDPRPLMEAAVHTVCNDIIEVAADGQSARVYMMTPGLIHSRLTSEKSKYCMVLWEQYGADFLYEDGQWKYLHEIISGIAHGELDYTNWAADEYRDLLNPPPPRHRPEGLAGQDPPIRAPRPFTTYELLEPHDGFIGWPEPYETLDNDNTYFELK